MRRVWLCKPLPFLTLLGCQNVSATVESAVSRHDADASTASEDAALYWRCADDRTRCYCLLINPETCFGECGYVFGEDVPYCRPYELCRVLDNGSCVCGFIDPHDTEMSGRPVDSCPVEDRVPAVRTCAAQGAPCSLPELSRADAGGCCEGLVCDLDGTAGLRCRQASGPDAAAELACRRAAAQWPSSSLSTTSDVVTSQGTIAIGSVGNSGAMLGPDGRLTSVMLHLFGKSGQSCDVAITAVAKGSNPHELAITAVSVRGFPCGLASTKDFRFDESGVSLGTLTLTPQLYCEAHPRGLCVQGTFDVAITGSIPAGSGSEELSFLRPLAIEGNLCSLHF